MSVNMSTRIYIGRLSYRASERDVEHFFKGYGRVREIVLKNGFGFAEFDDYRDADDAVYDLNGKELCGDRVVLEHVRRPPKGRDADRSWGRGPPPRNLRYPPPRQTRHRMIVENLSTRCSWQELKDMIREYDLEVTFTDAHRNKRNEGIVCFGSSKDLKKAIEKMDGKDVNGRKIHVFDDSRDHSRSRSRSGSRGRSRSRSRSPRSRSRSRSRSGSRSRKRSRSRSGSRDKSRSRSKSRTPDSRKGDEEENKQNGDAEAKASPDREADDQAREKSKSRSRSRSRSGSRSD